MPLIFIDAKLHPFPIITGAVPIFIDDSVQLSLIGRFIRIFSSLRRDRYNDFVRPGIAVLCGNGIGNRLGEILKYTAGWLNNGKFGNCDLRSEALGRPFRQLKRYCLCIIVDRAFQRSAVEALDFIAGGRGDLLYNNRISPLVFSILRSYRVLDRCRLGVFKILTIRHGDGRIIGYGIAALERIPVRGVGNRYRDRLAVSTPIDLFTRHTDGVGQQLTFSGISPREL